MKNLVPGIEIVCDRWRFNIAYIPKGCEEHYVPEGTAYVMLNNASYQGEDIDVMQVHGCVQTGLPFTIDTRHNFNGTASAVIIECPGFSHLEDRIYIQNELDMGNLSYMDGGTNTTAINPGRLGDPVINYVHFPAGMFQTLHTHPSHRVGLVLKGNGVIHLDRGEQFEIKEGEAFLMRRNELHNFTCPEGDVVLFVWAPDSGTGPTDETNPLKVRTYIGQEFIK
jgi:quercetin dioxygenase-like cupin family protein